MTTKKMGTRNVEMSCTRLSRRCPVGDRNSSACYVSRTDQTLHREVLTASRWSRIVWLELQKNAIVREVKRLELQVASLAAQLRRS
jgi:hypothetical protein